MSIVIFGISLAVTLLVIGMLFICKVLRVLEDFRNQVIDINNNLCEVISCVTLIKSYCCQMSKSLDIIPNNMVDAMGLTIELKSIDDWDKDKIEDFRKRFEEESKEGIWRYGESD